MIKLTETRAIWQMPVLCMLLLAIWVLRPFGVDAPAHVVSDFNTQRAHASLTRILGDQKPHPSDSDELDKVRDRLLAEIEVLGFTATVRDQFHCNDVRSGAAICGRVRNIFFWITPPGKDAVMITAHYDSVPAGPGASDDAMGVAIALEAARILKRDKTKRPILVLLTDAEEAGLNGAAAFAATDPLAKQVGAIVNLESRGTTGQVKMFETSTPNGNDFADVRSGGVIPSANSMSGDLYSIMPNFSDLTMLLKLPVDAANYSVIGGVSRYHTPLDNLEHVDRHSMAQLGANALSAVRGFAANPATIQRQKAEQQYVHADVMGLYWLGVPQTLALTALLVGLIASTLLFVRQTSSDTWRTFFAPLAACVAGTGSAILVGVLAAAARPETNFGTAHPEPLRLALGASALLGAATTIAAMRIENNSRLNAASWIWFFLLSLALAPLLPSFSTYAMGSVLPLICATALNWKWGNIPAVRMLLVAAAIGYSIIALPAVFGAEDALFIENAAPLTLLLVLMFLFFVTRDGFRHLRWAASGVSLATLLFAFAVTWTVPAHSTDSPRHLSVLHEDVDGKGRIRIYNSGILPDAILAKAHFAAAPDNENYWNAPATSLQANGDIRIISDERNDKNRVVILQVTAPSAYRIELRFDKGDSIARAEINGAKPNVVRPIRNIGCTGRACSTSTIRLELDPSKPVPSLTWARHYLGNSAYTKPIADSRPPTSQPVHSGDQMSVIRQLPKDWLQEKPV